jgi:hypothetical protein
MAQGNSTNQTVLPGVETELIADPETGLTFYLAVDSNELDPNGEPVIYELTASEYNELTI